MNDIGNRLEVMRRLRGDIVELIDALKISLNASDDWGGLADDVSNLTIIKHDLLSTGDLIYIEGTFFTMLLEMEIEQCDEKSKFIVQKARNEFVKDTLFISLEALLKMAKNWDFSDYRARSFQNDWRRMMTALCDWYRSEYNIQ